MCEPCCLWARRNVKQYPEATEVDGMLLLRIDAALYFANVNPVRLLCLWHTVLGRGSIKNSLGTVRMRCCLASRGAQITDTALGLEPRHGMG